MEHRQRQPRKFFFNTASNFAAARRKATVFEHRLLEKYQPTHDRLMGTLHKGMQKAKTHRLIEAVGPKRSLGAARALGWIDLGLEAINALSTAGAVVYLAGGFGRVLEAPVASALSAVASIFTDLPAGKISKEFLVFAFCAAVSKATVKIGTYVELAQMLVMDATSRVFPSKSDPQLQRAVQKYAKESIREQAKDTLLFWVPVPFLEIIRRAAAIRSEFRQLRLIRAIESRLEEKDSGI
jgi:hypothetical protein